ncbi:hypothetical protein F5Y04DRAFT_275163 [Hypomontagnella monticulosa]|nr:hypothetical protein F5Y04DRAFT_275163 [Hypomontagnella monticulosa]
MAGKPPPIEGYKTAEQNDVDSKDSEAGVLEEQSIDPENEVKGTELILLHIAVCLCNFLVGLMHSSAPSLDFNLIATAIPVITTKFDSITDVGWYGAAFQLAL